MRLSILRSLLNQFFQLKYLSPLTYFGCWFFFMRRYWLQAIRLDDAGNLLVDGQIWGDFAAHFTMGSMLAYRDFWPQSNPFLLGQFFNYPFLVNWISAMLIRVGVPFFSAFWIPSLIFSLLLVIALYYFFYKVFRSPTLAALSATLFLLNGGVGGIFYLNELWKSSNLIEAALNPKHWYTSLDININWMLVTRSLFFPQRALALGFPLTLGALMILWHQIMEGSFTKKKITLSTKTETRASKSINLKQWPEVLKLHNFVPLLLAGVTLGSLPIIHIHSFLAAGVICTSWLVISLLTTRKRFIGSWLVLSLSVALIAAPLLIVFFWGKTTTEIRLLPGWLANVKHENWLVYWFKNWGLTPYLAAVGLALAWRKRDWRSTTLLGPFILLFILANLLVFQPWDWDNTKLFAWSSLGISGFAVYALSQAWQSTKKINNTSESKKSKRGLFLRISRVIYSKLLRLIILLLFISLIFTGLIDSLKMLSKKDHKHTLYSSEELGLAEWVKNNTPSSGVWLTNTRHNNWLYNLTGRQVIMTYPGWLWSYGYSYQTQEKEVELMRKQPLQNLELLRSYKVKYVVIENDMINSWEDPKLAPALPLIKLKQTTNYQILQIN